MKFRKIEFKDKEFFIRKWRNLKKNLFYLKIIILIKIESIFLDMISINKLSFSK